jgi:hypothetical protein
MIDVCDYFNLHSTTTHAAIAYLDRLQPNERFSRFEWQMLAICCIMISAKYNECEEHVPDLATLEDITQQVIPNETVLSYELWALKRMGWKLNAQTPMAFTTAFLALNAGSLVSFPDDRMSQTSQLASKRKQQQQQHQKQGADDSGSGAVAEDSDSVSTQTEALVLEHLTLLANAIMLEAELKREPGALLAAAIIYSTRRNLRVTPAWCPELVETTGFDASKSAAMADRLAALPSVQDVLVRLVPVFETSRLPNKARADHLETNEKCTNTVNEPASDSEQYEDSLAGPDFEEEIVVTPAKTRTMHEWKACAQGQLVTPPPVDLEQGACAAGALGDGKALFRDVSPTSVADAEAAF